jgi:small subunit ribosomal protein S20
MLALHPILPKCQKSGILASIKSTISYYFIVHNLFFATMANHKSSKKRARQIEKRRTHNRYYKKSTRTAIKRLRNLTVAAEATVLLPKVVGMIDRLAKIGQFHSNKAANLKSGLTKHVNKLNAATAA